VCGCEGVTRAEIQDAIEGSGSDLNAVRIRTRASMGNCQGGFCCHRMGAELARADRAGADLAAVPEAAKASPATDGGGAIGEATVREAVDELYQERWKGQRHALWGEQLSQAALNHTLHATTMNRDADPVDAANDVDFAAFDAGREAAAAGERDADRGRGSDR